jgi:hypothetical protein
MRVSPRTIIAMCLVCFLGVICISCTDKSAKSIWSSAIKKCAKNDLLGKNVLYFGPSNGDGPGTVFQSFQDGGAQQAFLLTDYTTQDVIDPNSVTSVCNVTDVANLKLGGSASLPSDLPFSGDLAANLARAHNINVKAQSIEWVSLLTGRYLEAVAKLPDDNAVKKDLGQPNYKVLSRALRVSGLVATLDFDSSVGGSVKATVNGTVSSNGASTDKQGTGGHSGNSTSSGSSQGNNPATTPTAAPDCSAANNANQGSGTGSGSSANANSGSSTGSASSPSSSSGSTNGSTAGTSTKGIGINFTALWQGTTHLTICATDPFYIAGELRTYSPNGLAGPHLEIGELVTGTEKWKVKQ